MAAGEKTKKKSAARWLAAVVLGLVVLTGGAVVLRHYRFGFTYSAAAHQLVVGQRPVKKETSKSKLMTTHTINFGGGLTLRLHEIFNGDVVYFAEYRPREAGDAELQVVSAYPAEQVFGYRFLEYPDGYFNNKASYWESFSARSGELPCTTIWNEREVLSQVDVFEHGENSTLREIYPLTPAIKLERGEKNWVYRIRLPGHPGRLTSHWGVLSAGKLLDWGYEDKNSPLKQGDLSRARKLAAGGLLEKVAASYVPGDKFSFWFNPSQFAAEAFIRQAKTGGTIFTDLSLYLLYPLIDLQNCEGYWPSTPESLWLRETYGLGPNYFDTRFSTNAGVYLLQGYETFGEKKALDAAVKYGDYLLKHNRERGRRLPGGGILSPDYWGEPAPNPLPHTSLNHQLSEINFLYQLSLAAGKPEYKEAGDLLRRGIQWTGANWIRPNGDLWYRVESSGRYGMQDYTVLTYYDLVRTEKLLARLGEPKDVTIELLRRTKFAYAKKQGYL